jgi:Arc/MetJ-type ribon-helix-helix transcriptional regulator
MAEYGAAGEGDYEKITISVPPGTKARLKEAVDAGLGPNVSAVVASSVERVLSERDREAARQRAMEAIMERRQGRPLPPEAVAWARKALGIDDEPAGQGAA